MKGFYSYWVSIYVNVPVPNTLFWEGMVLAKEENGELQIRRENVEFFEALQRPSSPKHISWAPAWKDITDERRLPSGSEV